MNKHEGSIIATIIWILTAGVTWLFMLPSGSRLISALCQIINIA